MTSSRTSATAVVRATAALAAVALVVDVVVSMHEPLWGREPAVFAVFAGCALVTEVRPLRWLRRTDGGEVTASWTFLMAMVLIGSPVGATVVAASICVLSDQLLRKTPLKALFNACQQILSESGAALLLAVTGQAGSISLPHGPGLGWYPAFAGAAVVAFGTNMTLVSAVVAAFERQPLWTTIRRSAGTVMGTDGMLLALSPVLVIVAERSLWLVPLLLVAITTVYRSAQLAFTGRHEATHDLLTQLPNRRMFNERLEDAVNVARRSGTKTAVVMMDLNGFKAINDRLGHLVGDEVLVQVAQRLDTAHRPADLLARLGGDEFAMIIKSLSDSSDAVSAAERLRATLDEAVMTDGFPVSVGSSVGVALLPDHADDADTLLRRADEAMYAAKRDGRGVVLFERSGAEASLGRLSLLSDLNRGLEAGELYLEYQPQIDLATDTVVGVEALCRWRHPYAGIIGPATFMPLAEQTELIGDITRFVLREAVAQCARWSDEGIDLEVSVNVSARDVQNVRFPRLVATILDGARVEPSRIRLEITESSTSLDPTSSRSVLGELRRMGVTVSVDDFGTGFSSLVQLRDLHFDEIKLDRSFITDMAEDARDCQIVQSVVQLGKGLGLVTVAEGVEDPLVADLLRDLGCERAQGYLFGRPVDAASISRRLKGFAADLSSLETKALQ